MDRLTSPRLLLVWLLAFPAAAEPCRRKSFDELFSRGAYAEALACLEKIPASDPAPEFPDRYFQLGQTHYALMEFAAAKNNFKQAIAAQQKVAASSYYLASIEQLSGSPQKALRLFSAVEGRFQKAGGEYPLLARLQIAEIKRQLISEKPADSQRRYVSEEVIPAYEKVRSYPQAGESGTIASQRIEALRQQYFPPRTRNWKLGVDQQLGWDSNVIAQTDDATFKLSHTDSFFSKTEISGRASIKPKASLTLIPRLLAQQQVYTDRGAPQVYENDQFLMSAGMYTALVHAKTFGKVRAGETFFDFQLNYLSRDYQQKHQLSFFSNTLQFTLGEKTSLWSRGPTAFKCMYISQRNYDREFSSSTVGCAVAQEASVKRASLQIELGGDYKQTKGAINDVTSYKFLAALMVPALVYRLDYDISLSLSYLDPKNQHETRGVEQLVNFLQSISYPWRNNWRLKASLAIIDKNSRDKEHFAYHKQLIQGGISYGF